MINNQKENVIQAENKIFGFVTKETCVKGFNLKPSS